LIIAGGGPREKTFIAALYTFCIHQPRLKHSDSSLSNTISPLKSTLTNAKRLNYNPNPNHDGKEFIKNIKLAPTLCTQYATAQLGKVSKFTIFSTKTLELYGSPQPQTV